MPPKKLPAIKPDWVTKLCAEIVVKTNEPKGDNWLTTKEIAKCMDRSTITARRTITMMLENKIIERFQGSTVINGNVRNQIWYRPIKKK